MGALDTSTIAHQMKKVYGECITDLFKKHSMLYDQFSKGSRITGNDLLAIQARLLPPIQRRTLLRG